MATWNDLPQEIVHKILTYRKKMRMNEKRAVMEWRYAIVKNMDTIMFAPYWDTGMPSNFSFNSNLGNPEEVVGWFWDNETQEEPFIGADAIASFILINAQRDVDYIFEQCYEEHMMHMNEQM